MNLDDFNNAVPSVDYFMYRSGTPTWTIIPSQTDFIDLTYIIGGEALYTINGQSLSAQAGDLLCIPQHSTRFADSLEPADFACFAANFHMHDLNGGEVAVPLPLCTNIGVSDELVWQFKRLNEDWLRRGPGYTMRVRARFMLILQRVMETTLYDVDTFKFDSRVKTAIHFITNHYAEPLTISKVAQVVSLNPVYFGALFKKETKTAFRDYLNMIRLNQAEEMLRVGEWNVTEVAFRCGFGDVFYFSRLFKKHKGIPPSSVQP